MSINQSTIPALMEAVLYGSEAKLYPGRAKFTYVIHIEHDRLHITIATSITVIHTRKILYCQRIENIHTTDLLPS